MKRVHPLDAPYARQLAHRRRQLGLSQNDIALALGLAESTVGKFERLAIPVSPETRSRIEQILRDAELARSAVHA
jgi:transcriptional regulator with XRE-family HTH domain